MPQATKGSIRRELSRYVRGQTGEGQELIDFMVGIMRGDVLDKDGKRLKVTLRMQMEAASFLIERGWGKAPQEIAIETSGEEAGEELRDYSLEELTALINVTQN